MSHQKDKPRRSKVMKPKQKKLKKPKLPPIVAYGEVIENKLCAVHRDKDVVMKWAFTDSVGYYEGCKIEVVKLVPPGTYKFNANVRKINNVKNLTLLLEDN
jgi:hypothetical protein